MDTRIEGWLHVVNPHRVRIRSPRKHYFVIEGAQTYCYRSKPEDKDKDTVRRGIIHPYTRVIDNGREHIRGKVYHTFTLCDPNNNLKLAARSAEEAAKWMQVFKEAQGPRNGADFISSPPSWLLKNKEANKSSHKDPLDWVGPLILDASHESPDVISISPWEIFGCRNGLRLYAESESGSGKGGSKFGQRHPAIMAVGIVKGSCETIFDTVMALGPSRAEWDFCFKQGKVIEHVNGHTDIVHKQLHDRWLPGSMRPRDLLFLRYWRREYDGSYTILYRSVEDDRCPNQQGFVRAEIKSGGYVISPLKFEGTTTHSLLRHMLEVDWKSWSYYFKPADMKKATLQFLERIAALRELFESKPLGYHFSSSSGYESKEGYPSDAPENGAYLKNQGFITAEEPEFKTARYDVEAEKSFMPLIDAPDEFFDFSDESDQDEYPEETLHSQSETEGTLDETPKAAGSHAADIFKTATIAKRIAKAAHKKGPPDVSVKKGDAISHLEKEGNLPRCTGLTSLCCWTTAEPSTFLIRGKRYLYDNQKVKAKETVMQLIAVDWLKSDKREDHLASRPSNLMQKCSKLDDSFFLIVNLQVPGATSYFLALYYMMNQPLHKFPLLEKFANGDDKFRSSRFKLIPYVAEGSWIVKQSVGKTACLIGEALEINYFRDKNYIELDVNVGSSSIAKGVVSLVFGYLSKLVVEMAFLIQGNTEDELPEVLLGTCRIAHLDTSRSSIII